MKNKFLKRLVSIVLLLFVIVSNSNVFAISISVHDNKKNNFEVKNIIKSDAINTSIVSEEEFDVIKTKKESFEITKIEDEEIQENNNPLKIISNVGKGMSDEIDYNYSYSNSNQVLVFNDLNNDYYVSNELFQSGNANIKLIKHNIKENTNEVIYTYSGLFSETQYVKENVIYIEAKDFGQYLEGDCTGVRIIGFDISKNEVVFNTNFPDVVVKDGDDFHTFVVDNNERVFFEYEGKGIKAYDKNGALIFDKSPAEMNTGETQVEIVLHRVTPNNDGILYSINAIQNVDGRNYFITLYQGYQKLNSNGTFKNSDYTVFQNPEDEQYILDPDWRFISEDGLYAVNQYGYLARFNYIEPTEENPTGLEITIIDTVTRNYIDTYYSSGLLNPLYCVKDNYLYMLGRAGIIRVYDINNNFKLVGKYETEIEVEADSSSGLFLSITSIEDKIYVHYYKKSENTYLNLYKTIDLDDIVEIKNTWVKNFVTQEHTQQEISTKYLDSLIKFNVKEGLYATVPSAQAPYSAGKLKQGPIDDTLNRLNFYRWLYGVNSVTLNEAKMERNQKGGVILAAIDELTHTPYQPADMDDDFYKEAYAACYYGTTPGDMYNGNCAYGHRCPAETIDGFIDEIYNLTVGSNVGHRLGLLDLRVNKTSFGYCNYYTTLSMYYNEENWKNGNSELFYTYPTAGNFPMQIFNTSEYFSILLVNTYNVNNMEIEFEYNNKTYTQPEFHIENSNSIVFKLPDELINDLGGANKQILNPFDLNVKIKNLTDNKGDITNLDYDIYFYDVNNPEAEHILGDVDGNGVINATDYTMIVRYLKGYETLSRAQLKAADVDGNEVVNATDYTKIVRYLKGYENI